MEKFVDLKIASGMTAPHRLRDVADVQDIIRELRLPLEFADRLDPMVCDVYRQLWRIVQVGAENEEKRT